MHTTARLLKNNLFSFLCLDARGKKPIISAPLPPEIESPYFYKVLIPYHIKSNQFIYKAP